MDKNIVALLRDGVRSIAVKFYNDSADGNATSRNYTYLTTDSTIKVGDDVIVKVGLTPKVVLVVSVDEDLNIAPNSESEYKWVVCRVNYDPYAKLMDDNDALKKLLSKGYQANMRKQFREAFVSGLPDDLKASVSGLLSNG